VALPQLLGADGDAVTIIQGAGGDAGEITLNRIIVPGPIGNDLITRTIRSPIHCTITQNPLHGRSCGSHFNLTSSLDGHGRIEQECSILCMGM
jgi:hypothetical protein